MGQIINLRSQIVTKSPCYRHKLLSLIIIGLHCLYPANRFNQDSIDNLQLTTVVCLDISAAFDAISHSTLLQRLYEDFGVAGMPLDWLRSYLSNRSYPVLRQAWWSQFTYSQLHLRGPTRVSPRTNPVCCIHITTQPGHFQSRCRSSSIRRYTAVPSHACVDHAS